MRIQISQIGKKLNKKKLKTITGGLARCIDLTTGRCRMTGSSCAERECRYVPELPLPFD
ncbi:bacteriocin [Chryseobacterium joostei]|uniref:bacteriocin n=1 Tax=Chryseobacterium joostei TaxID=112234 RepID=UPI0023F3AD9D|nr:bacteriocin [Chryseobacterium joostei]